MIRRDYFIKLVQELSGVLMRVVSLRARREYEAALREIDSALEKYLGLTAADAIPEKLDHVLDLCSREEGPYTESIKMVSDVFYEQGEIYKAEKKDEASRRAHLLSLGLYLESVQHGFVSLDLLTKIDDLVQRLSDAALPTPVLRRL